MGGVFAVSKFHRETWRSEDAKTGSDCVRGKMVKDLRSRLTFKMTKEDVIYALGEPDAVPSDWEARYWLGHCNQLLQSDPPYLAFYFGHDFRLLRVALPNEPM